MNESRLQRVEDNITPTARKVYDHVPIEQPWSSKDICTVMWRAGTKIRMDIVRGCLRSLCDDGLVRELKDDQFQRVWRGQPTETVMPTKPVPVPAPEPETLLQQAGRVAESLRQLAGEIEDMALRQEQRAQEIENKLTQLHALKKLLRGISE